MDNSENTKRVAKNTFFLFLRMIIVMCVGLYTSRVVLRTLGIEDYGVYNVIGSVVVLFSFLQSYYIQKVNYTDSRTQKRQSLHYPDSQIRQFYAADISNLKYVVFGIGLFALAALYVSIRILRNLNKFIHK
mgnify:CR=1 FL=1